MLLLVATQFSWKLIDAVAQYCYSIEPIYSLLNLVFGGSHFIGLDSAEPNLLKTY